MNSFINSNKIVKGWGDVNTKTNQSLIRGLSFIVSYYSLVYQKNSQTILSIMQLFYVHQK